MDEIINRSRKEKRSPFVEANALSCVFVSFFTWEIWVTLPEQGYSSCKNSAAQSYQCVQYFCVSKQWCAVSSCVQTMVCCIFVRPNNGVLYLRVSKQWCAVSSCVQTMVCCIFVCPNNGVQYLRASKQWRAVSSCVQTMACSIFVCPNNGVQYLRVSKQWRAVSSCVQTMVCCIFVCPNNGVQYFACVQTMIWLPVFGGFNLHTAVDACNCTRRFQGHKALYPILPVCAVFSSVQNNLVWLCSIFMCPKQSCMAVQYFHVSKTIMYGCAVFSCVQNNLVWLCSIFMCPKQSCMAVQYFHVSKTIMYGCAVFSSVQNNHVWLCSIFMCPKQYQAVQYLGFVTCEQMLMHVTEHKGFQGHKAPPNPTSMCSIFMCPKQMVYGFAVFSRVQTNSIWLHRC